MTIKYPLDQTFTHKTATHEHTVHWTRICHNIDLPPLIFIHGTPWSSIVWHDLATVLSHHHTIYLYDNPGFGVSPSPHRITSTPDHDSIDLDGTLTLRAAATAALIQHWNLSSPPHVVAHDNGGLVALRLLLQHHITFASLCLIDVVAIGPFGLPFFQLVAQNEAVFTSIPDFLVEGFVRAYVKSAASKPVSTEVEDMLCEPWLAGGTQGPRQFLREMVQAHHRDTGDVQGEYGCVAGLVPVKIIWGKDDAWIPAETAERLRIALGVERRDSVVVVEDAGHLIHYDQPGRLAYEVGMWLISQCEKGS